jgi:hypothetical protein
MSLKIFVSFLRWGEAESICYVGHSLAYLLYQPGMIIDECGGVGGELARET